MSRTKKFYKFGNRATIPIIFLSMIIITVIGNTILDIISGRLKTEALVIGINSIIFGTHWPFAIISLILYYTYIKKGLKINKEQMTFLFTNTLIPGAPLVYIYRLYLIQNEGSKLPRV